MILRVASAVLALASAVGAAAQTSKVAPVPQIVDAVASCTDATIVGAVDRARLTAAGWEAAKVSDGSGKAVSMPVTFMGRKGNNAILLLADDARAKNMCAVVARIASQAEFASVRAALEARLRARPAKVQPTEISWFVGRELVNLALTGKPDAPSVRVAVMEYPEEKK